ncbi:MAG: peroxiredoxin [Gammaproteobacteria bacterium]
MAISVGDRLPPTTFKYMADSGPADLSSDDLFGGKTVAVFGLPGAYTPVCSAQHLPGFVTRADAFKAKGVDAIACVSVNDPFVMQAWGKDHDVGDKVTMLSDPTGDFTRAIGLELDLSDLGLGERSERYTMIVEDGVVKALNTEKSIFEHDVSSADALLAQM